MKISQTKNELRESLLAAETNDPALWAEYERKRNAMFETQFSMPKVVWFKFLVLFSAVTGVGALVLGVTEIIPPAVRTTLLMGAAFAGAWTFYLVSVLRRGVMRRRIDPPIAAGMGFVFALLMCVLMAVGGLPTDKVLLMAVLFLFPAGLILIRTVIEQAELRMQEQMVELQYKIAVLSKKLDDDEGDGTRVLRK